MGDVDLFCLVQGGSLKQSFHVTISREKHVSYLKESINAKCANQLQGVDANCLSLYRVSIAYSSEIQQPSLTDTPPLQPRTTIGTLFPDGPGENEYIFIVNGMMLRCGLICVLLCSFGLSLTFNLCLVAAEKAGSMADTKRARFEVVPEESAAKGDNGMMPRCGLTCVLLCSCCLPLTFDLRQ